MKVTLPCFRHLQAINKMSVFIQKLNPITGRNDWIVQADDYDYHQEVARASFADMLHDEERNRKYEAALKSAIELVHARSRPAHVLDIGTGTGLLSMMAARHGADAVFACEAFKPMSECALKIIKRNGYERQIRVIPKRSTDLQVGEGLDLEMPCNILVTEVFDTELIGEGALLTFRHALANLLEPDCIVVPSKATVFAQLVECPFVQNWNRLKDIYNNDGELLLEMPTSVKTCAGSPSVHDLQLSQLDQSLIKTITSPQKVFHFNWSQQSSLSYDENRSKLLKAEQSGLAQMVFMWWELEMDTLGEVVLSCAPSWAHPDRKTGIPWRDHWMQAIYYLPNEIFLEKGEDFHLVSCHDEFSLWFDVTKSAEPDLSLENFTKPICECGLHVLASRTRLGQLNDSKRNKKYVEMIEKHIDEESVVLVISDSFFLSVACAKRAKEVCFVESNYLSHKILMNFIRYNAIENVHVFDSLESVKKTKNIKFNVVLGEPYFLNNILPWDNLLFIYLLKEARSLLSDDVRIFPKVAKIKGIAMKFDDLNKIRLPLGTCQGFLMKDFDDLIEASSGISDDTVEAQPLWEYPGTAISQPIDLATIDCEHIPVEPMEVRGVFEIARNQNECNGIALWVEWVFDDSLSVSSGPILEPVIGEYIAWDVYTRQGVCLFSTRCDSSIKYQFRFDFQEGNFTFNCS